MVVYCATLDCQHPGQLEVFEESYKNYQKPKKVIPLTAIREQGLQEGTATTHFSCSPAQSSPRNSLLSSSPTSSSLSSTPVPQTTLYPFHIHLKNGETLDFYTPTPEDQRQWMKRLGMLLMFPYSPIPEEPSHNPIKDGFRKRLNPKDHNAGVWCVCVCELGMYYSCVDWKVNPDWFDAVPVVALSLSLLPSLPSLPLISTFLWKSHENFHYSQLLPPSSAI